MYNCFSVLSGDVGVSDNAGGIELNWRAFHPRPHDDLQHRPKHFSACLLIPTCSVLCPNRALSAAIVK